MALEQGDLMASLDLSKAYLHVPIQRSHRCFLHFAYGNYHYQYKALPFGLTAAPSLFTKLLIAPVAVLRQWGDQVYSCLDDILVKSPTPQQAQEEVKTTMDCLRQLGFVINLEKSSLTPRIRIEHLGLWIDKESFRVAISTEQRLALTAALKASLRVPSMDLMDFSTRHVGVMPGSCGLGMIPHVAFAEDPDAFSETEWQCHLQVTHWKSSASLSWWLQSHRLISRVSLDLLQQHILTTNASLLGWGAHMEGALAQET